MENKEKTLQLLEEVASGILGGAQQHFIHATINIQKGYVKLGNRMMDEYNEEMVNVAKIINRIIELGGTPDFEITPYPVYPEVENQLRNECQQQYEGLKELEQSLRAAEPDIVTKDFFTDYMIEETAHAIWLKQQVDFIESIGIQNYLAKQI
ncbi:MAG TPA: ferritin-like domain-containing protein [Dysgonomonas sp.]|uniref:ferritin-like domain-containing protein n=1 Tax=unclassified Dysgonomonas TaxID=2630389 RepID=UPI0025C72ADB|nr:MULTISPECIES: ferritin-like domain-containing protein [unclassified Dysgonomonas]HML65173.1 ferritin-like domain-containing protein [Dysgonomonas sp.]